MTLDGMLYDFPSAVYTVFFVVLLSGLYWRLFQWRQEAGARFVSPELRDRVTTRRSRTAFLVKAMLISVAWVAAAMALTGPKGHGRYLVAERKQQAAQQERGVVRHRAHDVVFLLDASASMNVHDARNGMTRLEYAKEIIDEVIDGLKGESVAVYAFTAQPTNIVPSTQDYLFARTMTRQIGINEGDVAGTDFVAALETVKDKHLSGDKAVTLIVLSDGGDTRLESLQGRDRRKEEAAIVSRVMTASGGHLRVFTIGMGSLKGGVVPFVTYEDKEVLSALDEELLKMLSEQGGGRYYFAGDWNAFAIAHDLVTQIDAEDVVTEQNTSRKVIVGGSRDLVYDYYFQVPLGLAIVALSWALLWPQVRRRSL